MDTKWYSNGLTTEKANRLKKEYAVIRNPIYGINDRNELALIVSLESERGINTDCYLDDKGDIKSLLLETKSPEVSKLEGKVIEIYKNNKYLVGISVNKNLI
jgi:hypothetical protein